MTLNIFVFACLLGYKILFLIIACPHISLYIGEDVSKL